MKVKAPRKAQLGTRSSAVEQWSSRLPENRSRRDSFRSGCATPVLLFSCSPVLRPKAAGMTLVEIMITLTIITLMMGLVSGALANYLRVTAAARSTIQIVGSHEKILRVLRDDLRQSSTNRSSHKRWWVEDDGKRLRLQKLTGFCLGPDGNAVLAWSSDDIVYALDKEGFVTRAQFGATRRIAPGVSELVFTEIDNGRVRVKLTNVCGNDEAGTLTTLSTEIEVTPQN